MAINDLLTSGTANTMLGSLALGSSAPQVVIGSRTGLVEAAKDFLFQDVAPRVYNKLCDYGIRKVGDLLNNQTTTEAVLAAKQCFPA